VQDDTGAPLPSVEVRISRAGSPSRVADVETDTSGQFRAPDLPPAEYRLEVSKPNFVSTVQSLREPGATTLLIRLVPSYCDCAPLPRKLRLPRMGPRRLRCRAWPCNNPDTIWEMDFHLAQINVARLMAPIDDPRIADFV